MSTAPDRTDAASPAEPEGCIASPETGVPSQDWLSRGLKTPAGRGWDGDHLPDAAVNAHLARHGVSLRPPPGDKPWPAGWLPKDEPVAIMCDEDADPFAHARVFDREARVRFLDLLADSGNVSKAAARVGVSRETAYRARRRHADFARVWDAALVHARARGEAEPASRALDGVAVPVMLRGEHVATFRKHDARYLLAHLARLDRRIDEDPGAVQRAEQFDELLAEMAGHETPDDFAGAVRRSRWRTDDLSDTPPTREEYVSHARVAARLDCKGDDALVEERAMDRAGRAARKRWEAWKAAGAKLLAHVLDRPETGGNAPSWDSVTSVNTSA